MWRTQTGMRRIRIFRILLWIICIIWMLSSCVRRAPLTVTIWTCAVSSAIWWWFGTLRSQIHRRKKLTWPILPNARSAPLPNGILSITWITPAVMITVPRPVPASWAPCAAFLATFATRSMNWAKIQRIISTLAAQRNPCPNIWVPVKAYGC